MGLWFCYTSYMISVQVSFEVKRRRRFRRKISLEIQKKETRDFIQYTFYNTLFKWILWTLFCTALITSCLFSCVSVCSLLRAWFLHDAVFNQPSERNTNDNPDRKEMSRETTQSNYKRLMACVCICVCVSLLIRPIRRRKLSLCSSHCLQSKERNYFLWIICSLFLLVKHRMFCEWERREA